MENLLSDVNTGLFLVQTLFLLSIVLWVYCVVDILKNRFDKNDKLIWMLAVILLPILGALLYIFIGRTQKIKQS